MNLRKLLFWIHLTCGVVAGAVILIMSVTGVLLTYQRQMTAWSDMNAYRVDVPSPAATRLSVDALVSKASATLAAPAAMTVTLRSDPTAPASAAVGQRTLFVNPYTGDVLGEGAPGVRAFFRRVTDWHRWLGASDENRATGRMITGASNLAFLIIVVSGPFLWWPKSFRWSRVRPIIWFKRGLSSKARDFNWHNAIGFWSAIPLVVIVASGVVMSYPWANNLVYHLSGEPPPVQAGGPGGPVERRRPDQPDARRARRPDTSDDAANAAHVVIDAMIARAAEQRPAWRTIAVRLPAPAQGPVQVTVDEGDGGQPQKRGTFTFDRTTGNIVKWDSQAGATTGRRVRSWLRFAHTGEVYGLTGQTVAGLASLGGVVLVWTGLALAVRRVLSWRRTASARSVDSAKPLKARRRELGKNLESIG